ncbi:MAG: hypothetical protein AAF617_09190 [Bacteroidota bacterium]
MGIFDFFKRKNETPSNTKNTTSTPQPQPTEIYKIASKYSEHIKIYINMVTNSSFAPIAAYEQNNGDIIGFHYTLGDNEFGFSATEAVEKMKKEFAKRLHEKSIASYAILYHSLYDDNGDHTIADGYYEPTAISIIFADQQRIYKIVAIPYKFEEDGFSVGPMTKVLAQEFHEIMDTPIEEDKDYFQERVVMKLEEFTNAHDVIIRSIHFGSVGDLWRGIFGFEHFEEETQAFLHQQIVTSQSMNYRIRQIGDVEVFQLDFTRMALRSVYQHRNMITVFPRITTDTQLEVTLRQLDEWAHVQKLEATVGGAGRDTFGIRFYATDYGFNHEKYHSTSTLTMKITGLIYVLDKDEATKDASEEGPNFHPDFCMYMPGQEWAEFGCFDFVAKLEAMEEVYAFNDKAHKGHILKLKLIYNEEFPDFFTIDMFVNENNIRFDASELHIGMKLTGMFQMLGEIAE